jgi:hypothetical protein
LHHIFSHLDDHSVYHDHEHDHQEELDEPSPIESPSSSSDDVEKEQDEDHKSVDESPEARDVEAGQPKLEKPRSAKSARDPNVVGYFSCH